MKKTKGFTLIEVLIVATIIGLLTAMAAISYSSISKSSRDAKRKTDLEQIRAALEMYRSNNSKYTVLNFNNSCDLFTGLNGYIASMPSDPKSSSNYYYRCNISLTTYTLGAYLETGGTGSCGNCKTTGGTVACNYCVGPYGVQ